MKIGNGTTGSLTQIDAQLNKKTTLTTANTQQPAKSAGDAFSVELSSKTEQLQNPQNPDEISRDRVAAIRDQLASGTYNISGKDVANKILGVLKG
jgi:flagellar biosynthesis anti-sigma factor FlgM